MTSTDYHRDSRICNLTYKLERAVNEAMQDDGLYLTPNDIREIVEETIDAVSEGTWRG